MRLLIVTQIADKNDPVLGFFHQWIYEFSRRFESVHVIALSVGEHSLPKNVHVHTLGKERNASKAERMLRYVSLLYSLRKEYTHVFVHMNPEYAIGGGPLWKLLGKKAALWYVHGAVTWRLRLASRFVSQIFTASSASCRLESNKVRVVGHGIDTEMFSPRNISHPPTTLTIGRLSPSKQIELLIEAMAKIRESMPNSIHRVLGGAGQPSEEAYAAQMQVLAKEKGVILDRPILHADVPSVLGLSDVFLNASRTASLDKAVLEAMSCGVVPVTSNPAFSDMLSDLGLMVAEDANAFSERARELLVDTEQRKKISEAVRQIIVEKHSLPRLMEVLQSAYETL